MLWWCPLAKKNLIQKPELMIGLLYIYERPILIGRLNLRWFKFWFWWKCVHFHLICIKCTHFHWKCAHFHLICIKCVHFHLICIKCTHFPENARKCAHFHLICIKCTHFPENARKCAHFYEGPLPTRVIVLSFILLSNLFSAFQRPLPWHLVWVLCHYLDIYKMKNFLSFAVSHKGFYMNLLIWSCYLKINTFKYISHS